MEVVLAKWCDLKVKEKYNLIGRYPEEGFIALVLLLFHSSQDLFLDVFLRCFFLNATKIDINETFDDKQKSNVINF